MEIKTGDAGVFHLRRGARKYEVPATIHRVVAGDVVLLLKDGREVIVPRGDIEHFEVRAETTTEGADVVGSSSEVASQSDLLLAARVAEAISEEIEGRGRNVSAAAWKRLGAKMEAELHDVSNADVRSVLREALRGVRYIEEQWLESKFARREELHHDTAAALTDAAEGCRLVDAPQLLAAVLALRSVAESDQIAFVKAAKPHVHLATAIRDETYHVREDFAIGWTATISTHDGGPPIEQPQVLVRGNEFIQQIGNARGPAILASGQHFEITVPLQVSKKALDEGNASFAAQVKYRRHDGAEAHNKQERFRVALRPAEEFRRIENPYARFSGGAVVDDDRMFFGRTELIERVTEIVTQGTSGQCFVLYGQKRTGKTSVLRQLEKRIKAPFLPVRLSLGAIDTGEAETSFIQQCIDALYLALLAMGIEDLADAGWPTEQRISARPLESFRRAFLAGATRLGKTKGWRGCRPVLLIDEFTYMYEYIVEGKVDASFMRQWKALLETGLFNAVIVGQDSMPRFKQAFPNEFGVTHDERITYLSTEDARDLADRPIRLSDGTSRYRGFSLEKVVDLSAGNPFYEMQLCDNLVRHLNENRLTHVTEGVVDRVVTAMCVGPGALSPDRFDSLITAAGESVAFAPSSDYYRALEIIAFHEEQDSAPSDLGIDPAIVEDMVMRDVVMKLPEGRLSIRVPLLGIWLRAQGQDG